jgi:predicted Zn finger-like uncharacterized protein
VTARTYPLDLPEDGDPRFTPALVDDVARVLTKIHGLPPVEGRDFTALADTLHRFFFDEPMPHFAAVMEDMEPLRYTPAADGDCPRCRSSARVEFGPLRGDGRQEMRCGKCDWAWSIAVDGGDRRESAIHVRGVER